MIDQLEFVVLEVIGALIIAVALVHLRMCRRDRAQLAGAHRRLGTFAPIAKADISRAIKRSRAAEEIERSIPDEQWRCEDSENWS